MIYISDNQDRTPHPVKLSKIDMSLNNLNLSLSGGDLKIFTKGEATIPLEEMVSILHHMVDEFHKDGEFEE